MLVLSKQQVIIGATISAAHIGIIAYSLFCLFKSNETIKQSNETIKQSNETIKQSNETIKQSNETIKQLNETIKQFNNDLDNKKKIIFRAISQHNVAIKKSNKP